jgi:hypothetical protein
LAGDAGAAGLAAAATGAALVRRAGDFRFVDVFVSESTSDENMLLLSDSSSSTMPSSPSLDSLVMLSRRRGKVFLPLAPTRARGEDVRGGTADGSRAFTAFSLGGASSSVVVPGRK